MSLKLTATCLYCGRDFTYTPTGNTAPVRWCSKQHSNAARNTRAMARKGRPLMAEQRAYLERVAHLEGALEAGLAAEVARRAAASQAESERLSRCPRKDKAAWNTKEAVELVIKTMRANGRPRSEHLRAYQCQGCSAWHAGDRTAYEAWQAKMEGTA